MADYCTIADVKARIEKTKAGDDVWLAELVTGASRKIDRTCRRPDGFVAPSVASARTFSGSGNAIQWLDECAAISLVEVKDSATDSTYTAWASTDWIPGCGDPVHSPDFNRLPYRWIMVDPTGSYDHFASGRYAWRRGFRPEPAQLSRGVTTVRVTARWGYALTVPDDIREACCMQVARWYKRFQSAMADAVASVDMGQLLYRQSLDPDIAGILRDGRYIKPAV